MSKRTAEQTGKAKGGVTLLQFEVNNSDLTLLEMAGSTNGLSAPEMMIIGGVRFARTILDDPHRTEKKPRQKHLREGGKS